MYPQLPTLRHTHTGHFFLMAGPCVIEDEDTPFRIAEQLVAITDRLQIPFVFKASYRKDNRSRYDSFTGIGDTAGLQLLQQIAAQYHIPVVTDVHSAAEAQQAARYVDMLQIPAFLCRQTSLLAAAAETPCAVNVKKGQFLSPQAMTHVVEKLAYYGKENVLLTERGTMFGYQDLVVDFRSIPLMQRNRVPVVVDITHSQQKPNQADGVSGGDPSMISTIARAAVAVGTDGLFMETHPNPAQAKSDASNMLPLQHVEPLLRTILALHHAATQPQEQ